MQLFVALVYLPRPCPARGRRSQMTYPATLCIVSPACPLTVTPSRFPPQGKSSSGAPTLAPRFLLRTLPRVLTSRFLPQACAHFPTPPSALCPDQAIIERHRHLSVLISAATYVAVRRGRHDERGRSTSSVAEYTRASAGNPSDGEYV